MLRAEARWLGAQMARLSPGELSPMLNVGSSTRKVREVDQPWIDGEIFGPLRRRGVRTVHLDLKADDGVDIVGDLADPDVWREVRDVAPRAVFFSNVLEHVVVHERANVCDRLVELLPAGGIAVVSVPRAFPYHPDPIDTRFRPTVSELHSLFAGTTLVAGEEVACGTVFGLLEGNVSRLAAKALRMAVAPRTKPAEHTASQGSGGLIPWLVPWGWKQFRATCVVLQKR